MGRGAFGIRRAKPRRRLSLKPVRKIVQNNDDWHALHYVTGTGLNKDGFQKGFYQSDESSFWLRSRSLGNPANENVVSVTFQAAPKNNAISSQREN
jgi:hypothetical protein